MAILSHTVGIKWGCLLLPNASYKALFSLTTTQKREIFVFQPLPLPPVCQKNP